MIRLQNEARYRFLNKYIKTVGRFRPQMLLAEKSRKFSKKKRIKIDFRRKKTRKIWDFGNIFRPPLRRRSGTQQSYLDFSCKI